MLLKRRTFTPSMANKKTTVRPISNIGISKGPVPTYRNVKVVSHKSPVKIDTGLKEVSKGGTKVKPLTMSKAPDVQIVQVPEKPKPNPSLGEKMKVNIATNNAAVKETTKQAVKKGVSSGGEGIVKGPVDIEEKPQNKLKLPLILGGILLLTFIK